MGDTLNARRGEWVKTSMKNLVELQTRVGDWGEVCLENSKHSKWASLCEQLPVLDETLSLQLDRVGGEVAVDLFRLGHWLEKFVVHSLRLVAPLAFWETATLLNIVKRIMAIESLHAGFVLSQLYDSAKYAKVNEEKSNVIQQNLRKFADIRIAENIHTAFLILRQIFDIQYAGSVMFKIELDRLIKYTAKVMIGLVEYCK